MIPQVIDGLFNPGWRISAAMRRLPGQGQGLNYDRWIIVEGTLGEGLTLSHLRQWTISR
ncbi:MAG TPA: hypothetical protein VGY98_05880 [Verrucomicrobiae bacterium]|nr:hypothetical protein [Verrucomicrobiae bacterium]